MFRHSDQHTPLPSLGAVFEWTDTGFRQSDQHISAWKKEMKTDTKTSVLGVLF